MKALALILSLVLSGCSVLFMEPVPSIWKPPKPLYCTASGGWAAWDVLLAGAHTVSGVFAFKAGPEIERGQTKTNVYAIGGANVAGAVIHLVSAVVGKRRSSECRDARRRAEQNLSEEKR